MSDLPADRLEPGPPFSNVGVDAFGPCNVRRTRGCIANSKRWGIIVTCLVTRAVHIEVVDSMSSSAFIHALRRFIAIRGKVNIFRSDRGMNLAWIVSTLKTMPCEYSSTTTVLHHMHHTLEEHGDAYNWHRQKDLKRYPI